ncbi:MAG: uridine diphosphate-N-acetylglucosamine-binding protein YvcK [Armatimonadetes bacterium]|nr:uridine diphosphate-N-acetylglucosamine-binding protein YvcK [Armatimonadota bacterium]
MTAFRRALRWLQPGLGVKRWVLLLLLGLALVGLGALLSFNLVLGELIAGIGSTDQAARVGLLVLLVGIIVVAVSFVAVVRNIARALLPDETQLVDRMWQQRRLGAGLRIVALGGGTGLSSLLRGLKRYSTNLTAVVVVSDDGGSSGRLRQEMPTLTLPPGDIRNCLAALADEEPLMTQLLQYRFDAEAPELGGHSLGNLLIAALEHITGDFEEAIRETSRVLAIRGKVLPPTLASVRLCAALQDGQRVMGESHISQSPGPIDYVYLDPPNPDPLPEVLEAIAAADLIVIGPGSLYTSIVPNLLVPHVAETIAGSGAARAYVCNIMTQPGETDRMYAVEHVEALRRHVEAPLVEYVILNEQRPRPDVMERYAASGAEFIPPDVRQIARLGYIPVAAPLLLDEEYVRHDPERLARLLVDLAQ